MEDGPFSDYPVSGQVIRDAANETRTRLASVDVLTADVQSVHRAAMEAVEGDLQESIGNAPTGVQLQATELNRKAEFAAGCLEFFALAVDDFDELRTTYPRAVSPLNTAWSEALSSDFGVSYDAVVDDSSPETRDLTLQDFYSQRSIAHRELYTALRAEYEAAEGLVDDAASEVSTMLETGPDDHGNVEQLWERGCLPFYAPLIFTDTDFSSITTTPEVTTALENHLDSYPDLREDRYFHALQSLVLEPEPSPEEIDESVTLLRDAGLLDADEEPDAYYLMWLSWSLRKGLDPADIVERAEQEEVSMETFDDLRELDSIQDPEGRLFFLLQGDEGAKDIARHTELLHGGTPSITNVRRSNNEWTYDGPGWRDSEVEQSLRAGAAVVSTPEGTMMTMPGRDGATHIVGGSGTTWMEMFSFNKDEDDPEQALRDIIEAGTHNGRQNGLPLTPYLLHERLHTAQWAEWGWRFDLAYAAESATQGHAGSCGNKYEEGAVFDWGGYDECTPWSDD